MGSEHVTPKKANLTTSEDFTSKSRICFSGLGEGDRYDCWPQIFNSNINLVMCHFKDVNEKDTLHNLEILVSTLYPVLNDGPQISNSETFTGYSFRQV